MGNINWMLIGGLVLALVVVMVLNQQSKKGKK